jgi:hypothetical protein
MVPLLPAATNCVSDQVTPCRSSVVPETCSVHVIPSGDVRMVPSDPTATNCVPDQVTPRGYLSKDVTLQSFPWAIMVMMVSAAVPEMPPDVAAMVVEPALIPVTRPALLTVAFVASEEPHVTVAVMSRVVPFEKVPVAVNCRLVLLAMVRSLGVTVTAVSIAVVPPPPPQLKRLTTNNRRITPGMHVAEHSLVICSLRGNCAECSSGVFVLWTLYLLRVREPIRNVSAGGIIEDPSGVSRSRTLPQV